MAGSIAKRENSGVPITDVRSLRHGFSAGGASALAFSAMRPLVGIAVGGYLINWAGLAGWLSVVVLLVVILIVSAVFGALASRWPLEGSVAAWTRQSLGAKAGMMAGWLYLCSFVLFMGTLAFFDAQRIFYLANVSAPTAVESALVSAAVLLVATALNAMSRRLLFPITYLAVAASAIGCLVFGTMLMAHSKRGFFDLFQTAGGGSLDWSWLSGPFLVALAWSVTFCLRGFELPSDVAEEVRNPRTNVARAMFWTVLAGGILTIYVVIAVALAVPEAPKVVGEISVNPYAASVGTVMETALGATAAKIFAVLMIIATFAALAVSQLGASRTLWSMARDREIPQHRFFAKLSAGPRLPVNALVVVGILAAILPFILTARTAYVLGGASTAPLLLALLLPVIGLWKVRRRGEWLEETKARSRWLSIGIVVAACTLTALAVDVAWPHEELYLAGFSAWRPLVILAVILTSGFALMARSFRRGGVHVRNHGHVDRDLDQRIALAHTGTCSTCHQALAQGDEAYWNPEAHVTRCLACESVD